MPKTKPQHGTPRTRRTTIKKRVRRGRARCLQVEARPDLRAEPDWDRFAWALLQYVRSQREASAETRHKEAR